MLLWSHVLSPLLPKFHKITLLACWLKVTCCHLFSTSSFLLFDTNLEAFLFIAFSTFSIKKKKSHQFLCSPFLLGISILKLPTAIRSFALYSVATCCSKASSTWSSWLNYPWHSWPGQCSSSLCFNCYPWVFNSFGICIHSWGIRCFP